MSDEHALTDGQQIGSYEIGPALGAGGMGRVYRARDLKLGREVAIKVLRPALTLEPEHVRRFEREARMLASLNHPNIAAIYGLEEAEGVRALVLEMVEGPTVADRLRDGPVPVPEALRIADAIADGLDAAHQKNIIHRDLKPANVKVGPDGVVKVLDLGLAKLVDDRDEAEPSESPTADAAETREGVILGTIPYMSPEQVRGQPLDKRTDIWSFGCVLYELLTGQPAFTAETPSDTSAAILDREPDFDALPTSTPESVRKLLRRCLAKDRTRRLRDIGDARLEIDEAIGHPEVESQIRRAPARTAGTRRRNLVLGSALVLILAVAVWRWLRPVTSQPAEPVRLTATLPQGARVTRGPGFASSVALSPDGRTLVIAGTGEDGQQLYRRPLDRLDATPLPGTTGGSSPFFSPDGAWIGFYADGRLMRVPAEGGGAVEIATVPGSTFLSGASWGDDDRIVFGAGVRSPLYVVDASGGDAEPLTTLDAGEVRHVRPDILPDGRTVLFESSAWIHALDLVSGARATLVEGVAPRFAATGHVILSRGNSLLAAPFDRSRLELTGPVVPLVEGVAGEAITAGGGIRHYAISGSGTLAYVPAAGAHALVIATGDGTERVVEERLSFENPQFSPDGLRLAVATRRRRGETTEIWIHDLETGAASRLTFEGGRAPVWTPDGEAVTFSRLGEGQGIYTKPADGRGDAEQLLAMDEFHWLVGWTPDGRTLAFGAIEGEMEGQTSVSSIVALTDGERHRILGPGPVWGGRLSPDGEWLAYYSLEAGRFEVYVTPFPEGDTRWLISEDGGRDPSWSPDGGEIYYRSGDRLFAAEIETAAGVRVQSRRLVLEPFTPPLYDDYDIHPDGRTLVMVRPAHYAEGREVVAVIDWFAELRRLAGP